MAIIFLGVRPEVCAMKINFSGFLFRELSRYIAAGRLHCKVDKVGGIVETNRPDSKNWQYQATIKQGDILLNRVQKLSRVINI
jgi:26S proteasome regulatory subunit N7